MILCPECETDLDIDEDQMDEGEIVSCAECGTDFEVITVNPIELKAVADDDLIDDEEEDDQADAKGSGNGDYS